ncbi:MAG: glycosyltransferase family 4 protein [Oscillospiraceae bacterium]|nr:glycosyltransferase family 4 protein [Oscillospiraceae bacterium]
MTRTEFAKFREEQFVRRNRELKEGKPQKLIKANSKKENLHIVYVMVWTGVCGGSKIILEHCNRLVDMGQKVTIVSYWGNPDWFKLNSSINFIQVSLDKILCESIPACDVIVVASCKEIHEAIEQKIAPVIYFEQGDTHLFHPEKIGQEKFEHCRRQFQLAQFIYTVSSFARTKIKENYNREAKLIPNAIDRNIFYPNEYKKFNTDKTVITAIGSENVSFKCIDNILAAIKILEKKGYEIDLRWITPDEPTKNIDVPYILNPPQNIIAENLRESDIYVCASEYESFCLPVLEALACGAVAITTNNGGIRDFIKNNENGLVIEKNNIDDMVQKIELAINDIALREKLSKRGIETSKNFDWDTTMNKVLEYYKDIATNIVEEN